jgi:energy-converting hydrogenase Eha subunit G
MKIYSMIGSFVVIFALVFYSIGFAKEQKKKLVTSRVLLFYTLGVFFDISATTLMILGSSKGFSLHGFIGYSSLLGMCIDTFLLWRHNRVKGPEENVSRGLNLYSRIAYIWWVVAFITGGLLVALRHHPVH